MSAFEEAHTSALARRPAWLPFGRFCVTYRNFFRSHGTRNIFTYGKVMKHGRSSARVDYRHHVDTAAGPVSRLVKWSFRCACVETHFQSLGFISSIALCPCWSIYFRFWIDRISHVGFKLAVINSPPNFFALCRFASTNMVCVCVCVVCACVRACVCTS